jgi:hypothetical protein
LTNFTILELSNEELIQEYKKAVQKMDIDAICNFNFLFYKIHIFDFDSLPKKTLNKLICGYYVRFQDKSIFLLEAESSTFEKFGWNSKLMQNAKVLKNSNYLFHERLWKKHVNGSLMKLKIPVELEQMHHLHKFWFDKSVPLDVKQTASNLQKIIQKNFLHEIFEGNLFSEGMHIEKLQKFIFDSESTPEKSMNKKDKMKQVSRDLDYFMSLPKNGIIGVSTQTGVDEKSSVKSKMEDKVTFTSISDRTYDFKLVNKKKVKKITKNQEKENIKTYMTNEELTKTFSTEKGTQLSIYGTMTLNIYQNQLKKLKNKIKYDKDHYYTYNKDFFHQQISPFDEKEEKRKTILENKKKRLFGDFILTTKVHYPELPQSKVEEVNIPLPNLFRKNTR